MNQVINKIPFRQVEQWKKDHKHLIHVVDEEGGQDAYFIRPTVEVLQKYNHSQEEDIYGALAYLFDACILNFKDSGLFYEDDFKIAAAQSIVQKTNTDKQIAIDASTGKDEIKKSAALVRHYFNIDPYELPADEFYKLLAEAVWLQDHKNKQLEHSLANVLVKAFGERT